MTRGKCGRQRDCFADACATSLGIMLLYEAHHFAIATWPEAGRM